MKTYTIEYRVFTKDRGVYHPPPEKVYDCMNDLFAKLKLEAYVAPKYTGYIRMEVISCKEDFMGSDVFNDIFKAK